MIIRLLNIAKRREKTALSELGRQKAAVANAQTHVDQCRQSLEDFQRWRPEEENRLFSQLCTELRSAGDIDDFQATLAQLQRQENDRAARLAEAETELQKQQQRLLEAQNHYQNARKKLEKFQELHTRQQDEARIAEAAMQELEQEDKPFGPAHDESFLS